MGRPKKTDYAELLDVAHLRHIMVDKRVIYVMSDLNADTGNEHGVGFSMSVPFIKNMRVLESINHEAITVVVNTTGGDVYQGFAIYDAIKQSPCHVTVLVHGIAMSMGSVILQASTERVLMPNALIMFHSGSGSASTSNPYEVKKSADFELKLTALADKIIYDRINAKRAVDGMADMSPAKFKQLVMESCWLTAQEAVDMGIADRIYTPSEVE